MQSKNGYLINWKDLRNKVTVVIPIITLLILSYSVFIAGPNANRMTQNTLQQIVNNTQPQMPYLIGGAECKIFTTKNVKEYNFPLNNSNDYYADIFHLLVSGKSATSPRIKVRIPKADFRDIKREYIRT